MGSIPTGAHTVRQNWVAHLSGVSIRNYLVMRRTYKVYKELSARTFHKNDAPRWSSAICRYLLAQQLSCGDRIPSHYLLKYASIEGRRGPKFDWCTHLAQCRVGRKANKTNRSERATIQVHTRRLRAPILCIRDVRNRHSDGHACIHLLKHLNG